MANILVTGGAGYIGSQTCKTLSRRGHNPVTYDNLSRGFTRNVQWGPLVEGDLFDLRLLKKTLEDHEIEAVIHFAAYAYIKESVEQPEMYFQNNLYGSLFLLDAMDQTGVNNLVFSSTCATYGEPAEIPISESHPQEPINPYGLSKLMVESVLKDLASKEDFKFCGLRYFNAGGADPKGDLGESHDPEPHILPNLIRSAMEGRKAKIMGGNYPTPDGTCIRDFIHVLDLAEAHGLVVEGLLSGKNPMAPFYNLGTGKGYSLLEVVDQVSKSVGKPLLYSVTAARPGDPSQLVASAKLFEDHFNWKPKHSSLEEVIRTAFEWEKSKKN